jgi:hypothetical protein
MIPQIHIFFVLERLPYFSEVPALSLDSNKSRYVAKIFDSSKP